MNGGRRPTAPCPLSSPNRHPDPQQAVPANTGSIDRGQSTGVQGLLGQVAGRTSAAVARWLAERGQAWRDGVEVVAIDPSAPYAAAVHQRVTREYLGRRGRRSDPVWSTAATCYAPGNACRTNGSRPHGNACLDVGRLGDLLAT